MAQLKIGVKSTEIKLAAAASNFPNQKLVRPKSWTGVEKRLPSPNLLTVHR